MAEAPRLSFCTIARNEAANIARCLASAAPVADEMIVVDTGSTDETVALAQAQGAAVSFFAWCDDFSAARNAAIERATGDWILWLDADEELLPESRELVQELIATGDAVAYLVQRQEVERDGQTSGFIEMRQLRLWRNLPELRFTGRCHPHFGTKQHEIALRDGLKPDADSAVRIRHTGYRPQFLPGKLERGARLMEMELADRPGQLYYEVELGRVWTRLGDPRGPALLDKIRDRVIAEADGPNPPDTFLMPVIERCIRLDKPNSPNIPKALRLVERWFMASPPLLDAAAEYYYKRNEFARAIPILERLVSLSETGAYDRTIAFPSHILGDGPLLNLAVCHHRLGRLDDAERWYNHLLSRAPGHSGALQNLAVLKQHKRGRR